MGQDYFECLHSKDIEAYQMKDGKYIVLNEKYTSGTGKVSVYKNRRTKLRKNYAGLHKGETCMKGLLKRDFLIMIKKIGKVKCILLLLVTLGLLSS